ncbi:hypothetical protein [Verrucosispora sp. WMMC514]|uniref:hypothetical protein n=1 Tax=Verrucosispora sp. WMMC514 TaxID=3015156 RepID=UPI0032B0FFDA
MVDLLVPPAARLVGSVDGSGAAWSAAEEAERVVAAVLADLHSGEHRGVVVDSPPVVGKSLVIRAAIELARAGEPLVVIAQVGRAGPPQRPGQVPRLLGSRPGCDNALGRCSSG